METTPETTFRIGPCGWSYPDWNGTVYPARRPRGFKPLAFIARYFNAVEVNSSFYAIPQARVTEDWTKQVPDDFRFAFKLTQNFTHGRDAAPEPAALDAFKEALRPVKQAELLGPVLMQFPWSFRYTAAAREHLQRLADGLDDFERVVEVRHASWAQPDALELLRNIGQYCNIDQPQLRNCLGPTAHVFGPTAYVRLHGRNAANWFAENIPGHQRYNYLYSHEELREWIRRLHAIARRAKQIYVFTNNHYWGQSPANALEIRHMLENKKITVPPQLLVTYPRLQQIALPPRQPGLFE